MMLNEQVMKSITIVFNTIEADEVSSNIHDGLEIIESNISSINFHKHNLQPYFSTTIATSLTKNFTL